MQTPGKQIEPQTPMITGRGKNSLFERLSKAEENIVNIERPQNIVFGNFTNKFEEIDNTFQRMQDIIKSDISEKRKYFLQEESILKEDSKNLQNLRNTLGRQLLGAAAGIAGLAQLAQGNIGAGAGGVGAAAAILSPEILGFITSIVAGNLAKSGFLGRGGGLGSKVTGASKLQNPILMSAALAASLILPGLISSNQTADRRRQLAATRSIRGRETINEPDVDRFRGILSRFDKILSSISISERESKLTSGNLLEEAMENEKIEEEERKKEENNEDNDVDLSSIESVMGGSNNLALDTDENDNEKKIEESDKNTDNTFLSLGDNITNNNNLSSVSKGGSVFNNESFNINNSTGNSNVSSNINMFESTNTGGLNLAFDFLNDINVSQSDSQGESNIIDLTSNSQQNSEKKFTSLSAVPASIFVSTNPANLDIDLIEHSDALRTWAAYA